MMPLLLFLILVVPLESAKPPGNPKDPALGARIKDLLHTELTSDEENSDAEDAAVREILSKHGLPTIAEVGDEAAYDFVLLLAGEKLLPELQAQVLPKLRSAVAHHELPADAGVYYAVRVRLEETKRLARSHPPANPDLRDRIENLVKADQEVRAQKGFDATRMQATDARNSPALQEILDQYGVPTFSLVGPQAAADFVLMIQHQPARFRQQVLPKLKALVDAGQADPGSYALVYDLSQRDQDKKQLYGERLECGAGEKMHEAPIEDESHVNQRRAELGLMRVELYASLVAELMPQFCQPAVKTSSQ
jgi:hypothetical protein